MNRKQRRLAAKQSRGNPAEPFVAAVGHFQAGRLAEAEGSARQALDIDSRHADSLDLLGVIAYQQGRGAEARILMGKAIAANGRVPGYHNNLGIVCENSGMLEEAASHYLRALALKPDFPEAHYNLGHVLQAQGRWEEAAARYRQALFYRPGNVETHNNLGMVLDKLGRLHEAVSAYGQALALNEGYAGAHMNLANALMGMRRLDDAILHYRRALALQPDFPEASSNLLFCLNYHPDLAAREIFAAYRDWGARFGGRMADGADRKPEGRLKIGYVSPDFRVHSARHFIAPLLENHDRRRFELFAYAGVGVEDGVTASFKGMVDHWIPTVGMSDDSLAARIREDRIDILVDLAGHTVGNRLLVFARTPAPVQVSWLGYGYTTGLAQMDYFLGDGAFTPPGAEDLFTEKLVRLPIFAAYRPAEGMGDPGPLPAASTGRITFGTLTRLVRLNHRVIRVWAAILRAVPGAALEINSHHLHDPALQHDLLADFAAHGITADRLVMGCESPPWNVLRRFDISLDCFPHNSGTTLYESLYMGVPFITLADRPSVGRMGASILTGLGHPEWIAATEEDYVAKAVALASDTERLAALRAGLRGEMRAGPLMDEAGFARAVEAAYENMAKASILF